MKFKFAAAVGSLIVSGGLAAAATGLAALAQADPNTDLFIDALNSAGLQNVDPGNAAALGQQVCPMLADSGQSTADVAAKVADSGGMSLGPATMFTGIAISMWCPGAMARLGNGQIDGIPGLDGLPAINDLNSFLAR
ncbi:MAG: DUF732 domain-containing protein [Mycobacterium sp.]